MDNLNQLPAPPSGQKGLSPDVFSHLPPPPKGQTGINPSQIKPQTNNTLLDNPITRGIENIFPGKQVGQAIGTAVGAGISKAQGNFGNYDLSAPSPLQTIGDVAQGALTIAAPNVGNGATALGRVGANAALGTGLGATNAVAQGEGVGGVAKEAAIGGAVGGGVSGAGEIGNYLTENMPRWFTRLALPKLSQSNVNMAPNEVVDYALNNTKGATLRSMYNNSNQSMESYEDQIQNVLSHPNYSGETGSKNVIRDVIGGFSNAQLEPDKVVNYVKQVALAQKALVDKVANGNASLVEKNTLRKALDSATSKRFIQGVNMDSPKLSFAKEVGAKLADILRGDVQGTAKETAPIFKEYSKEIQLNKALGTALSKRRVALPALAGVGGLIRGGVPGALEAIAVEEGLRSPTTRLMAGKVIRGIGKVANPIERTAFQAGKASLIKDLTNRKSNQ